MIFRTLMAGLGLGLLAAGASAAQEEGRTRPVTDKEVEALMDLPACEDEGIAATGGEVETATRSRDMLSEVAPDLILLLPEPHQVFSEPLSCIQKVYVLGEYRFTVFQPEDQTAVPSYVALDIAPDGTRTWMVAAASTLNYEEGEETANDLYFTALIMSGEAWLTQVYHGDPTIEEFRDRLIAVFTQEDNPLIIAQKEGGEEVNFILTMQ